MSLEAQLAELNATIGRLIDAINGAGIQLPAAPATTQAEEKPAAKKSAATAKAADSSGQKSTKAVDPVPAAEEPAKTDTAPAAANGTAKVEVVDDIVHTYDDVKNATLAAVKTAGKQPVVDLLASYGAAKADQIPQEKWGEYLAKLTELTAQE